jgi:RNA polymerase subunit RPABC4/transcription elongation factor Spt4
MALIRCPDCEREVSSRAHSCPQCAYPIDRLTNFSDAILQSDSDMVRDLLHAGFKMDEPNSDGYTPLMLACQQGDYDITKLLVDSGADVNRQGEKGTTALMEAASNGHDRIVKLLIEDGVDPLIKNQEGQTALDIAVTKKREDIIPILRGLLAEPEPEPELEEALELEEAIEEINEPDEEPLLPPVLPETVITDIPTPLVPPPLPVEAKQAFRLRTIDDFAPALEEEKYSGPGFVCRSCQQQIAPEDIWCSHCKAPIIRRYCGGCRELIPDNAARCPYCNSSKLNRFRYIRNLEQIVAGTVVLGVFLFLLGIYNPSNNTSYATKLAEKREVQQDQVAKTDEEKYNQRVHQTVRNTRTQTPTEPAVVRIIPRQTDQNQILEASGEESHNQIPTVERIEVAPDTASKIKEAQPQVGKPLEEQKPELEKPENEEALTAGREDPAARSVEEDRQLEASTQKAMRLNEEGFRLMKRGRYSDAIPVLAQALRTFPSGEKNLAYAYALFNLGRSLRLAGRPDLAIPILEERMKFADQRHIVARELEVARIELNEPQQYDNVQFE